LPLIFASFKLPPAFFPCLHVSSFSKNSEEGGSLHLHVYRKETLFLAPIHFYRTLAFGLLPSSQQKPYQLINRMKGWELN
jgi:hypothetical protein